MSLAVVVSGVLRNMKNASGSWSFKGDYHLVTENNIYLTQTKIVQGTLQDNMNILKDCFVNFRTINVCMDTNIYKDTENSLWNRPSINMAWKWKVAYYNLLPYSKMLGYDRVLLIRPDMWILNLDSDNVINDINIDDDEIHTLSKISFPEFLNGPWMGDMFMLMNFNTFHKVSKFYDYLLNRPKKENDDIHNLLGKYILKNNIIVTDELSDYYSFITLRDDACDFMFEDGVLNKKYSYQELVSINGEYVKKLWKH